MSTNQRTLNFFLPSSILRVGNSHFRKRAWFENELAEHFDVNIYCKIEEKNQVDEQVYQRLSDKLTFIDFFDHTHSVHFAKNYQYYRKLIHELTDVNKDLYFVMYPYMKTSIFLAHILSDYNLSIWVKSDYVGLFGVFNDPPLRSMIKTLLRPVVRFTYPKLTKFIFEDNVIFYSGDVIYEELGHINQYSITSLSPLNERKDIIKTRKLNKAVFVGDSKARKGLNYALEALRKADRDISLTIIGMEDLGRFSSYRDVIDIDVAGVIYDNDRFYEILASHDVLLMPSICERQGKVQIEAMSAGVVPICSDSGGTFTTVENLYNGILFEERNVDGLVESIDRLYSDWELYHCLQNNGLEYTDNLDISKQVQKMATVINHQYTDHI